MIKLHNLKYESSDGTFAFWFSRHKPREICPARHELSKTDFFEIVAIVVVLSVKKTKYHMLLLFLFSLLSHY